MQHHIDPVTNMLTRKTGKKKQDKEEKNKNKHLSSWRSAPRTERKQKVQKVVKKRQMILHVRFKASSNPPRESLVRRIRMKQAIAEEKAKRREREGEAHQVGHHREGRKEEQSSGNIDEDIAGSGHLQERMAKHEGEQIRRPSTLRKQLVEKLKEYAESQKTKANHFMVV